MGRRISKEFLHPSILESVNDKIGNLDSLETDAKGNMVQAINELAGKIDTEIAEGKELIANAVGEPLTAEESFDEMSNDINGLLSTFKANMMNNGVTVESSDKFKALIDKIATLADNEGNKVQFVTGFINTTANLVNKQTTWKWIKNSFTFDSSLDFTPTRIILSFPMLGLSQSINDRYYLDNYTVDSQMCYNENNTFHAYEDNCNSSIELYITNISNTGFDLYANKYTENYPLACPEGIDWCAIGVGEEDTTLRDSLASILENKGVDVSADDDMASLISKVDSISGGLDIISATELPATGRENQICVITDNPVNNFIITSNYSDINTNNTIYIFLGNSLDTTGIKGTNFDLVSNNITMKYYLLSVHQGGNKLDSYIFKNNQWTDATMSSFYIVEKGNSVNESYTGGFTGDWAAGDLNGTPCYVINIPNNASSSTNYMCFDNYTVNKINLSDYTTLEYTIASNMPDYSFGGEVYMLINTTRNTTIYIEEVYKYWKTSQPGSFTTYTIDISDITGEFYLGIAYIGRGYGQKLCVSDIRLY